MKRTLHYFFVMFFLGRALLAQSPAGPGRAPFGSYSDNNLDSINLYNGNLMVDLNLAALPGRELSSGLRLVYNAQGWIEVPDLENGGTYSYYAGGWRVNPSASTPTLYSYEETDCEYFEGYHFADYDVVWQWTDGSGSAHYYSKQLDGTYYDTSHTTCIFAEILEDYLQYNAPAWVLPSSWSDPTRLRLYNGGAMVIAMEDGSIISDNGTVTSRNGNYQSLSGGSVGEDTLGRTIDFDQNSTSGGWDETYTVTDANGNPQDYVLHYTTLPSSKFDPIAQQSVSMQALTSIVLPNGQSYAFEYAHDQGFMTKITLPTGAYIAYEYQGGNTDHDLSHNDVVERHVSEDGTGQTEKTWEYSRGWVGSILRATVTQPEDEVIEHDFNVNGVETATRWRPNSSSDPIRTVLTQRDGHGRPTSIETQQGGLSQVVTQTWDSNCCGNWLTQQDQSDWFTTGGSVVPLARTVYTYDSNFPKSMTQVELKKWSSGSYVAQGKTELFYDEGSLASTSGVPHKSTPLLSRRNLTRVRRYKDASNYVEEQFDYDDVGNVVQHEDARGKSTTISYADNFDGSTGNLNTNAYPTLVTNAEGHETETVYNYATGLPVSVFDARGMETTFEYDLFNRTKDIYGPGGSHIHYTFDDNPAGTLSATEEVTVETGVVLKVDTFLDWLSRPIQVKRHDPAGDILVDTEYDENGRVKRVSMPYRSGGSPVWTTPTYDALDRSVTVTNPDSTTVSVAYSGNTVTTTDEAGVPRRQTFNGLGQLTKVEEPDPDSSGYLETHYSYEVFGPLAQVSQGSQTRTFTHDWLGRMTQEVHPETGTTSYTYDNGGLVTTRTDARGLVTNYIYDEIGRIYDVTYDNDVGVTKDAAYRYDQNGFTGFLTTAVVDTIHWTTFEYDDAGNLAEENVTFSGVTGTFTTEYEYDLGGRLLEVTYPSGRVVTQSYVNSGGGIATDRTNTLTDSPTSATLVSSVTDNAAGAITARTLSGPSAPSAIAETRSFNSRNQLTHITAAANSATLLDMGYGYGTYNDGRIRARTDAVQPEHSAAYTFDEIGRLTAVSGGDSSWGISWTLDRYGNRTAQTPHGLAIGRVGSPSLAYSNNKMIGYTYDAGGNVTYDGSHHFYYDAENRIYKINSTDVEYAYDHAGRRIKRKVGSVTTYYVYGLTGLMSEFSTTSGASGAASTDRLQYRVGEQTGTAVMLLDAGGVPRENNRVFPFGEPWLTFAGSNNNEKFTTYQHDNDAASDLDYAMARYYASRSGRFMTPDPGHVGGDPNDPQSWNAYVYVVNDPINLTDPTGLCPPQDTNYRDCPIGTQIVVNVEDLEERPSGNAIRQVSSDRGRPAEADSCWDAARSTGCYIPRAETEQKDGRAIRHLERGLSKKTPMILSHDGAGWFVYRPKVMEAGVSLGPLATLIRSLQQMSQVGRNGSVIAKGRGIRDVERLISQHGGKAEDWVKMGTKAVEPSGVQVYAQTVGRGSKIEIHYYWNSAKEIAVELKSVFMNIQPK